MLDLDSGIACSIYHEVVRVVGGKSIHRALQFNYSRVRFFHGRIDVLLGAQVLTLVGGISMSWSYSKISTYERCPSKKKYRYDEKIAPVGTPHPAAARGNLLHKDLEDHLEAADPRLRPEWINPHLPHLNKLKGGGKEIKLHLNADWELVEPDDRDLICVLDVIKPSEDDMQALIVDYKSGKRYDSHQDQLELYCLAALHAYPMLQTAEGACYYLDEKPGSWGMPVFVARSQMEAVRARWEDRKTMMDVDSECAPRPGWYCKFCEFRNSEGGPCAFG